MAEQIKLHSFRKEVDSTYVGFTPNGGSISLSMLPTEFKDAFLVALTRQCR